MPLDASDRAFISDLLRRIPLGGTSSRLTELWLWGPRFASKTITFTGASALGLAGTNVPIFTVVGEVLITELSVFCSTDLTEASATATVSLGITNNTTLFIGATNSTLIDSGEFWVSTTPTADGILLPAAMQKVVITQNVVIAPATQDTDGGVLRVDCFWRPLSADGLLTVS